MRSRDESRLASGGAARNVDASQINCTFYDALGRRDTEYLVARAIQCFVPGIPQIYYVGLLAGTNDLDLLRRTREGRDINRHYYTPIELQRALAQPVVQSLLALLRIRNTHAAFQGAFHVKAADARRLALVWEQRHGVRAAGRRSGRDGGSRHLLGRRRGRHGARVVLDERSDTGRGSMRNGCVCHLAAAGERRICRPRQG